MAKYINYEVLREFIQTVEWLAIDTLDNLLSDYKLKLSCERKDYRQEGSAAFIYIKITVSLEKGKEVHSGITPVRAEIEGGQMKHQFANQVIRIVLCSYRQILATERTQLLRVQQSLNHLLEKLPTN